MILIRDVVVYFFPYFTMMDSMSACVILQITPGHDPNDFEVGNLHNLKHINIFTDDGKINSDGGSDFVGMPRFEARVAITEALKSKVLFPKIYTNLLIYL